MSRRCELSGIGVQFGNNVSHSNRKTKRVFKPNLQTIHYKSNITGQKYKFKIAAHCISSIEKAGGFDLYMIKAKKAKLANKAKLIKNQINLINKQNIKKRGNNEKRNTP